MTGYRIWLVAALLTVPAAGGAYQADLVPTSARPEAAEITGSVSIVGADGRVRVTISSVNDAAGDPLDSNALLVQLKVRVNGQRRRVIIPLGVDAGDGEAETSLGLVADDRVIVQDVRVRGPGHRTLAQAGIVTAEVAPPAPPPPPPPLDQCPAALVDCQSDLASCAEELDACEQAL